MRDLAITRDFYEKLGFDFIEGPIGPEPVAVMEHPTGININFILNASEDAAETNLLMDVAEKHTGFTHIALEITDREAVKSQLAAHGMPITETVELPNGDCVCVSFAQLCAIDEKTDVDPCFSKPGLILLPTVTEHTMQRAIESLYDEGWFAYLRSIPREIIDSCPESRWPPVLPHDRTWINIRPTRPMKPEEYKELLKKIEVQKFEPKDDE